MAYRSVVFVRLLVTAAIVAAIAACGGGDDATPGPSPSPVATTISDPAVAVKNAIKSMRGLRSYEMHIAFTPFGAPIDNYVVVDGTDFFERIPADLSLHGGSEYFYVGDYTYKRTCTGADACDQWVRSNGKPLIPSLGGTVPSIPETLGVVATELATGWTLDSGIGEVQLSATVDLHNAVLENQRRAFTAAGNSLEEINKALAKLEDSAPPKGPSAVILTLTPDNHYIIKIAIATPNQPANPYMDTTFSNYNNVIVGPPEDYVTPT